MISTLKEMSPKLFLYITSTNHKYVVEMLVSEL